MRDKKGVLFLIFLCLILFFPFVILASDELPSDLTITSDDLLSDLKSLSISELMEVKITSVAKKPQKFSDAAAAVFVITEEDIRRSGVTSIPEALRMVPGVQVARIDANKWAISCRGFNDGFANKLLVLIDGRSVYTPLFSGVFWDVQDTLIEDIDRIEVIRGPGASLWGANAVNGVINIITKHAKDTQGGLASTGYGNEERGFGNFRYGEKIDDNTYYRIYGKYFNRDSFEDMSGKDGVDDWDVLRGGFRIDSKTTEKNSFTLQGDIYSGKVGGSYVIPAFFFLDSNSNISNDDTYVRGGNLLGRWEYEFSDTSDTALQIYYDRTERDDLFFEEDRDTLDIDFQHRFIPGERHEIVWGLGYRFTHDDFEETPSAQVDPDNRWDHLLSAFLQDEITLLKDRLYLTLGSKFEYNSYTEFEIQPNVRLLWTPHERHTLWTSIARAVRTPSRAEETARFDSDITPSRAFFPVTLSVFGDDDYGSEELIAYELGYRTQATDHLSLDITAFFNDYDHLRTVESSTPFFETSPITRMIVPLTFDNKMEGETYGIELAADWQALKWWRFKAAYTYLQIVLDIDDDSNSKRTEADEGRSPHNQLSLRSSMDLPQDLELDMWLRYVDRLPNLDIDSYVTLDARIGWEPIKNLEFSIVGQNLLQNHHEEFTHTEVERGCYGKITWRF